jgi:CheY-like chemotaxis protein
VATILVVDDEQAIVETVCELLAWDGHVVASVSNGERALAYLASAGGARPDLVLLDFMMPVMDGIQALRAMRAHPDHASIPVLLMTAAPTSIPADAPSYEALLVKPFTAKLLRERIRTTLGR